MSRKTEIELTNLCLICKGNDVLVQEKVSNGKVIGWIFPGGHVEPEESFRDAVIREIREETGLLLHNPKPCGHKDWIQEDGSRYIALLYKADSFSGELTSSREGRVFWLSRDELDTAPFIWYMRELMPIFDSDKYSELFFKIQSEGYETHLLE